MFAIIFIGIVIVLVFYYLRSPFKYWERKGISSPPTSFPFGNISEYAFMKKNLTQVFDDIYNKYPDLAYIGVYKGKSPCLLLRDPELMKHVLIKSFNSFRNNEAVLDEKMDPLFSKNTFFTRGDKWKETRSQLTPTFTAKRMKMLYPVMESACKNMIEYINNSIDKNDGCLEAKNVCGLYSLDNVTRCVLGLDSNSFKDSKCDYITMNKKLLSPSFWANVITTLLLAFPSLATLISTRFVPIEVEKFYRNLVSSTLEYRRKNGIHRDDVLDTLQSYQNKLGKNAFTNDDIAAHVLAYYVDGYETSSIVLCFVLYELSLNPDIKRNLEKEIKETRIKYNGALCYEALQEMCYLDMILNESMRKHTTVSVITRVCNETFTFPPPNGKGPNLSVEPETPIIIPLYSLHHDEKYFPDPLHFDPERFSAENVDKINKSSFMPFGEGPRTCLGLRFGVLQIKLALVSIVENFEMRVNPRTKVPYEINPHVFLLSAKGGIWLDFRKNKQW